jgi:large subunit ribosomal protein L14
MYFAVTVVVTLLLKDIIVVSVKKLRNKRKFFSKVKKGKVIKALIVRTKTSLKSYSFESFCFKENSVVLRSKQNKIGTRLFGVIPSIFRYTRYLKIVSLAAGLTYQELLITSFYGHYFAN